MLDVLPLPPHPNVGQYEKLAKDLHRACQSGESGAVGEWAARSARFKKADANAADCTLADAEQFVAREHGFADWPAFVLHLDALTHADSPVSEFEAAVDAIVTGNSAALRRLLTCNPRLATARSSRQHNSTLLHYVSANGVENFRQKTPENIVEIAKLLLDAGAEVDAESAAYDGRSTTLYLTATSVHPERVGMQLALMELLIGHGAKIDGPDGGSIVNACLHNGRGQAAVFLAGCGSRLDLEGAAGVGQLDVVKSFFAADGSLNPAATGDQIKDGFTWACQFGRTQVVSFLLDRGMEVGARLRHHGQTGLHWAAFSGEAATVRILLERRAPVDVNDETFGTTPLGWALHAWRNDPEAAPPGQHRQVAALLVAAGAKVEPDWLVDKKVLADPEMAGALNGRMSDANFC